METENKQLMNQ